MRKGVSVGLRLPHLIVGSALWLMRPIEKNDGNTASAFIAPT